MVLTEISGAEQEQWDTAEVRIVNVEITSLPQRQQQERHFHEQDRYILPPVAGSHTGWRLTAA